jgi:hypothetical protein
VHFVRFFLDRHCRYAEAPPLSLRPEPSHRTGGSTEKHLSLPAINMDADRFSVKHGKTHRYQQVL